MSTFYGTYPIEGIPTYATTAALPSVSYDGALALVLSTYTLYTYEAGSTSWVAIANPGAATAIDGLTGDVTATGPGVVVATLASTISGAKIFSTSLQSPIFKSSTANPASAGVLRLANTDLIEWRNAANSANFSISLDASNILQITAPVGMNSQKVSSVLDPTSAQDAATKNYVDTHFLANPMTTLGDIIYGGASGTPTRLAGNTAASTQLLSSVGSGGLATAPVWLTATNASTASTIVLRDGSSNFSAGTITAALTGIASGNTTYSANNHGVVLSSSTNAMTVLAPDSSATKVLKSGGASADPSWLAYDNANTVSTLVFRDSSGNFSAGTITATVTGTSSGNTSYSANNHGVVISGAANVMTVIAPDASATKVLKSGGSSADPSWLAYDNANTASTLVFRDGSGNFTAGTVTAALTGTASGNTTYSANNHGLIFSSATNAMTVLAPDASTTKVLKSGGSSADPSWATLASLHTAPTVQKFTSSSGTYTTPTSPAPLYIRVVMVGGGGGGFGTGTSPGAASAGGNTTFGSSLLVANGGSAATNTGGAAGGTGSLGSGPIGVALSGASGSAGVFNSSNVNAGGGAGGNSYFGGGAGQSAGGVAGGNGVTNSGGGGAGGSTGANTFFPGGGGGAGGFVDAIIASPSATYAYAVGATGGGSSAGTNGTAGGSGAAGIIIVYEFYQ